MITAEPRRRARQEMQEMACGGFLSCVCTAYARSEEVHYADGEIGDEGREQKSPFYCPLFAAGSLWRLWRHIPSSTYVHLCRRRIPLVPAGPNLHKTAAGSPPLQEAYVRSGFVAIPTTRLREKRLIHAERRRGRQRNFGNFARYGAVLSRDTCNNDAFLLQCSTRFFFPFRRLAQKRMTYWGGGCWPPFHFDRQPGQDISGKRRKPEIDVCLEDRGEKRNGHKNLYFYPFQVSTRQKEWIISLRRD